MNATLSLIGCTNQRSQNLVSLELGLTVAHLSDETVWLIMTQLFDVTGGLILTQSWNVTDALKGSVKHFSQGRLFVTFR